MALPDFRVAQTVHGGAPMIEAKAPSAGETFSAGQVVFLEAAGTVAEAVDDEAGAYGVALDDAEDSTGTLRTEVRVAVFDGNTIFSGRNVGAAFVYATHQGDAAELNVTAGVHGVGVATAGNGLFHVLRADSTDDSRVLCVVPAANSQYDPFGTVAPS